VSPEVFAAADRCCIGRDIVVLHPAAFGQPARSADGTLAGLAALVVVAALDPQLGPVAVDLEADVAVLAAVLPAVPAAVAVRARSR
jgi:hypothetical protein